MKQMDYEELLAYVEHQKQRKDVYDGRAVKQSFEFT